MTCAACPAAFSEDWPRGLTALRCGAKSERKGYVTETFPTGHIGVVAEREPPAWCPLRGHTVKAS